MAYSPDTCIPAVTHRFMTSRKQTLLVRVAAAAMLIAVWSGLSAADERDDFFEAKIRPILAETCFRCHGGGKVGGSFRVDSREGLMTGGDSGPAIVPGNPEESLLVQAIRRDDGVSAMPPDLDKTLRPDQVADFAAWIKGGAHWPEKTTKFVATKHWAFEPIADPPLPEVHDAAWPKSSIDTFILAKHEAAGAKPSPQADKLTLIRRATFDLTGLPPTPQEIDAFQKDESPQAFEPVIDRLLKSRAYGERWGRHWLDVVRYADTAGETADYPVPLAWRYRNYVIDAFNADKPYDRFLKEQLAGDIMGGDPATYAERVTATGYLAISRRFGFDSENYHHLTIQDTIDTLGQSVLGLSLGCCRCHDHKFDAVTARDYYALYGIFDSSRYAFPGSEQKQKFRSMASLLPPREAQSQWRAYEMRLASIADRLTKLKQPVPSVVLRSLSEIDGDFELQAPAAGGSNGVLVPPWLYQGRVAITNDAQSPFKNRYPSGRVGATIGQGAGPYRIEQAVHPGYSAETAQALHVNLDFRVGEGAGNHRFVLRSSEGKAAAELLIDSKSVSLRSGEATETLAAVAPNQWQSMQLTLDWKSRTLSGRIGAPGSVAEFQGKPISADSVESLLLVGDTTKDSPLPAIAFDNLALQDEPLAPISTEPTAGNIDQQLDPAPIAEQLRALAGIDGDFELQTKDAAPATPWGPGPNSVVKISGDSQSPYRNIYPGGQLGIFMPNRAEYDGFGMTIPSVKLDDQGRLFASFDFRCATDAAGGNGSWRYYLGHGPGPSAAIELFFNHREFFRRSGDNRDAIAAINVGEWYQVQLMLDTKARTYQGHLLSRDRKIDFAGEVATGWDGQIDYTFIDSYGHIGGVRPALDADNFSLKQAELPPLDVSPVESSGSRDERIAKVTELKKQMAAIESSAESLKQELQKLLVDGPYAMTYGMSEGTPHNVRMQLRGEPDHPGDEIPRGFIKVLGGQAFSSEAAGSGRLELAEWLTNPKHPLTARVMANRIWQYHFGRGLVRTPNDFGVRGMAPTHPELLDHLATHFVRDGWSIKAMHRRIMLSATYQQAAHGSGDMAAAERYTAFLRRRLSAEEIRDSILVLSGELDAEPGKEHPFPSPTGWGYSQHGPFVAVYDHNKRSVYLMTQRIKRHPFLALFDGPDPNTTTADRLLTTVPTQSLYFLNDPFVHTKADRWAARLIVTSPDAAGRVESAFRSVLGRTPSGEEITQAVSFIENYEAEASAAKLDNAPSRALAAYLRTLLSSNEFLHVE